MGLDLSALLPSLAGAARGYSSGSGLDLAMRLREQAALDELAVQKYQQFSDIRGQQERAQWQHQQDYLRGQDLQAKLASIAGLAPQLDTLGIENEGFEGDLAQKLQELTLGQATLLEGAMRGEVAAATGKAEMALKSEESSAKVQSLVAGAVKNLAMAGYYSRMPHDGKPQKPTVIKRKDGVYILREINGQPVAVKIPGIGPEGEVYDKGRMKALLEQFDFAYEEVESWAAKHPDEYAVRDEETNEIVVDKADTPILDPQKIAEEAMARADSRVRWASGTRATGGGGGESPGGKEYTDNAEDIIARLRASGLSDEEISMAASLEGIEYDPDEEPFQ